jgi:O-methyltransferase
MFDAVLWEIIAPKHTIFWGDRLLSLDKAAGFLENPSFLRSYETIRGSHIYDAYDSPHTIAWRLHTLVWVAQTAISKDGDFVECGVFKGDMSWVVMEMLGEALNDRAFYLYDSFQGISPSQADPQEYPDNPNFLEFANKIYSDPNVYDAVLARFGRRPNVKIVRGFLPESFELAKPERIAYLHIDLNSANAEISVLEALFDRVVSGGVIVFDDYGWKSFSRQREAEDRFMAERGPHIGAPDRTGSRHQEPMIRRHGAERGGVRNDR